MFTLRLHDAIRVYATVDRITPESAEFGDAEERGWVNSLDSSDIYESRNDVKPIFEAYVTGVTPSGTNIWSDTLYGVDLDTSDELHEEFRELVQNFGADFMSDADSTLYAADTVVYDYTTADEYAYAIHAHVKRFTATAGYAEVSAPFRALLAD